MRSFVGGVKSWIGGILFISWCLPVLFGQDSLATGRQPAVAIVLKTYLEKSEIPRNQRVNFHIELSWQGAMSRFQFLQIPQPSLHNLLLESSGSANRLEALPDGQFRATKTIMYQFRPVEEGAAFIDPITIHFRDTETGESDALRTQQLALQITPPVEDHSGKVEAIIYRVLLAIFVGTILYFVAVFVKKRRAARRSGAGEESLESQYLKILAQEIDPKCVNLHDTALRLEKIFREYLEKAGLSSPANPPVPAQSPELLNQLCPEEVSREKLVRFFEKMQMVRFGGAAVEPLEFSEMYQTVEEYLRQREKQRHAEHV